jgi:photosystem II stability/assembly factor-like uncharacterized protein
VIAVAIDPKDAATIFAAPLLPVSAIPPDQLPAGSFLFKSTDGGATWNRTGNPTNGSYVLTTAVAVDPVNSSVVYAFFSSGLFRSTDGGATWTMIGKGLPENWAADTLVIVPGTPKRLYAAGQTSPTAFAMYRSDDAGANWTAVGSGLPENWTLTALAIDPANSSVLYAGTGAGGLYRSQDAAATWTVVPNMRLPMVKAITMDASSRIYVGAQSNPQDAFVMRISQ